MRESNRRKLEAAGWKPGSVDEFLDITPDEPAYIEMKLALSHSLRQRRLKSKLSQIELAKMVHSSQSRIAKMKAGDPSVSMDLFMKSRPEPLVMQQCIDAKQLVSVPYVLFKPLQLPFTPDYVFIIPLDLLSFLKPSPQI